MFVLWLGVLLAFSSAPVDAASFSEATAAWHAQREKRLASENGWLTMVAHSSDVG